jgi:hypothetical protein
MASVGVPFRVFLISRQNLSSDASSMLPELRYSQTCWLEMVVPGGFNIPPEKVLGQAQALRQIEDNFQVWT